MDANNSTSQHYKIMEEISDGQLYFADDVVKAGTCGCRDCSWCCEDMCDTIFLDPYDIYALQRGVGKEYKELIEENFIEIGLHISSACPILRTAGMDAVFLLKIKGVACIVSGLAFAGCFLWEGTITMTPFPILCKPADAGPRSMRQ